MSSIDMDAILKEARAYLGSAGGRKYTEKEIKKMSDSEFASIVVKGNKDPASAGEKFIDVLTSRVNQMLATNGRKPQDGYLGFSAIEALSNLSVGSPVRIKGNQYSVPVWFNGDLSRPSLRPDRYDGIDNIVALLNNGLDTDSGRSVFGYWHGEKYKSLSHRKGARFIEQSIDDFMEQYASDYGVIKIEVDPEFTDDFY